MGWITITAIIGGAVFLVFVFSGKKKRPGDAFTQQAYELLAGSAFYNIMIARLDRLHEGKEDQRQQAALEFGVDLEKARDALFEAAFFHFNILQYGITRDDMRQDIGKFILPNFLNRLQAGDMDSRMSLAVMPFKYAAWLDKLSALGPGFFNVDNLVPHPEEIRKGRDFLLKHASPPGGNEVQKKVDTIPIDHNLVIRYFEYWERFGYPDR
jgi:hypothetical protein